MCGILGIWGKHHDKAEQALSSIAHRGQDNLTLVSDYGGTLGHVLHALVGTVPQPVRTQGTLLYNGEIYNWRELAKTHGIKAENDTQLLAHLLDRYGAHVYKYLDGVYAFAYIQDNTLILQRDLLGVKPLWYSADDGFCFASEAKAIKQLGLVPREVHPRTTLTVNLEDFSVQAVVRPLEFPKTDLELDQALLDAVKKRIPDSNRVGILFSGGVDSAFLALIAKQLGAKVTLYVAALDDEEKSTPHDLLAARQAAEELDLPLVELHASLEETEDLIKKVTAQIETANPIKVGVALPFWLCCQKAHAQGERVLLSGLGAEELFAGYSRHKQARDINQECLRGLRAMHERDLYRDDVVSMTHTVELRLPFLDHALARVALDIPGEEKIVHGIGKWPLRQAAIRFGLSQEIALRPKKAAQYGSQFDAAIDKLARRNDMKKGDYLRSLYPVNTKLCALLSSGKDSVYALYTMQQMNYEIAVCATILSENEDSYMYHTPVAALAKEQADSMEIPWISASTTGEKEEELSALKEVLLKAKQEFDVTGVVSGALFSNYQRTRIEQVCEEIGLRIYAPLWHLDQEQEVREVLDAGFTFILSKVAAEGLDRSFVGRPITHTDIDAFRDTLHLNVAGEGGEYESLVIDGPNFRRPISLDGYAVVCENEGSVEICSLKKEA